MLTFSIIKADSDRRSWPAAPIGDAVAIGG